MKQSVIQLNSGCILKGEYVQWNQYGLVMKNITELKYENQGDVMKETVLPSIYPKDTQVCFDRHFIISEYTIES